MKKVLLIVSCLVVAASLFAIGPPSERNPKVFNLLQARFTILLERGVGLPDIFDEIANPPSGPGGGF